MKYVSERIVNIAELKGIIQKARLDSLGILEECKKNKPSIENIEGYAYQMEAKLLAAENFDFLIERETTIDKLSVQGEEGVKEQVDSLITELASHITEVVQKNNISCSYENEIADKTKALAQLITARAQLK